MILAIAKYRSAACLISNKSFYGITDRSEIMPDTSKQVVNVLILTHSDKHLSCLCFSSSLQKI